MKSETVFINCLPEDRALAERVKSRLAEAGISAYLPDEAATLSDLTVVLQKLESVRNEDGILLVLLSQKSAQDHLVISNTQYFCEITGRKRVLVICKLDDISGNNAISLYYPRSSMVNLSRNLETGIRKTVISVKRLLGIEVPKIEIPRRLNRRVVTGWATGIAILAFLVGIASFFYTQYTEQQRLLRAAEAAAQAPVVINIPFTDESIDQGLVVDRRALPVYQATDQPDQAALFHYEPAAIHKRITFDDPEFENSLDYSVIGEQNESIREGDLRSISQQDGVLHLAARAAAQGEENVYAPVNHLFSLEDTTYIGIRFRLGDYQGWSDAQQHTEGYIGTDSFPLAEGRLKHTKLSLNGQSAFLGTAWHTLEGVVPANRRQLQVYLDGKLFAQVNELPQPYLMNRLVITYVVRYATDWVNLYVDEIVFGGEVPLKFASEAEEAKYHYSLETPEYLNDFQDASINQFIVEGDGFQKVEEGSLRIDFPKGNMQMISGFEIPTQSMDQVNYYAARYRVVQTPQMYWNYDGFFQMGLESPQFPQQFGLNIQAGLDLARYSGSAGERQYFEAVGSEQNFQMEGWHTMEWVMFPAEEGDSAYLLQYWFDQRLIGEQLINNPDGIDYVSAPLKIKYSVSSGDASFGSISVEIAELVSGYLPLSEIDR